MATERLRQYLDSGSSMIVVAQREATGDDLNHEERGPCRRQGPRS
jgi:hypothetical protein